MKPKRAWTALLLVALGLLAGFSTYLALTRIYQVDECQNFYMAKVLAAGESSQFFTSSALFLFGPLGWLSQTHLGSSEMFAAARLVFLSFFWLNLLLLAWLASGRLFSVRGLIALICAATLAPLWDYGFEIRHDNLVVTGLLLIWGLARVKPLGVISYLLVGAITVALLFVAVKSLVYAVPLSFALLVFPPPRHKKSRWQLTAGWICGALVGMAVVRLCYGSGSAWDQYLSVFRGISKYSAQGGGSVSRFWPGNTLARLLVQSPLLLALTFSAVAAVIADLIRRGRAALTWDGILPEALLFLGSLGALLTNPNPFPYNLLHVVPYAFVFAFRYVAGIAGEFSPQKKLWPLVGSVVILTHLVPFGVATLRHLDRTNFRQKELMRVAEELTGPAKDPVYDAIGMVPTRPSIHHQWYLHSLIMGWFKSPGSHVRDILAAQPPAVLIPSYRTDWLPEEDHQFIEKQYVPLADDFWVLGTVLPAGGGSFEIVHAGRYCIVSLSPSQPMKEVVPLLIENGSITGDLDGTAVSQRPTELKVGAHRISTSGESPLAIIWVGPNLAEVPRLSSGDHRDLFVNWY